MNEKMKILTMLQEGKITADEASRLLSAVENSGSVPLPGRSADRSPDRSSGRSMGNTPVSNDGRSEPHGKSGSGVDFDELGRKFAAFAKDLEPKVQKAAGFVAEKTVDIADRISDAISKTIEQNYESAAPRHAADTKGANEKHIELLVENGYNELNLSGLNGDVNIKGYNGDKISATVKFKPARGVRNTAAVNLMQLGSKYYLNYEEDYFESVSVDAYVPSDKFKIISISGINGNMDVSNLYCERLTISNTNGQTVLSNIAAELIKSESGNGRQTISDISAGEAVFEHFNGTAEIWGIDVEKLAFTNFNGGITASVSEFSRYSDYLWNIETSNAKLTINVPSSPNLGYHIIANAALGDIKIGLSNLDFITNNQSMKEARTVNYDTCGKKIKMAVETSNATLTVN